jgi:hypothetical protein
MGNCRARGFRHRFCNTLDCPRFPDWICTSYIEREGERQRESGLVLLERHSVARDAICFAVRCGSNHPPVLKSAYTPVIHLSKQSINQSINQSRIAITLVSELLICLFEMISTYFDRQAIVVVVFGHMFCTGLAILYS